MRTTMTQNRHALLRNLLRVEGFTDGAGKRALAFEYTRYPDYRQGYVDGYVARNAYAAQSAKEFGVHEAVAR